MHGNRPRSLRHWAAAAALASLTVFGVVESPASADSVTTVYASPTSTASSPCTLAAPCRIDHAIAAANTAGDTVIVLPGTYSVTATLDTGRAITIEGQPGQARPALVGAANLGGPTVNLTGGATLSGLEVETTSTAGGHPPAVAVNGGTAEDLIVNATAADSQGAALTVATASPRSVVATVLATSQAPGGEAVSVIAGSGTGSAAIDNLTAVGQSATTAGVSNSLQAGTALIENSILSGGSADIAAAGNKQSLKVSYSDFRPSAASSYIDNGGNVSAAPVFVNSANGDFHEDARSSTIDAGIADSNLTATDLDGNPRTQGAAPDMGAYEFVPPASTGGGGSTGGSGGSTGGSGGSTGTGGGSTGSTGSTGGSSGGSGSTGAAGGLPLPSAPVVGVSVTLRPAAGTVDVELPGTHRFLPLAAGAQLPVGTVIDAAHGQVLLTSAVDSAGHAKTGRFGGSRFIVRQPRAARARTALQLAGGSFAVCTRLTRAPLLGARAASGRPRHKVVRQLWGSDNGGSFTTIGRSASAAVRGTVWLTQDRCDGTLIRVLRGHVLVHDSVHHRNILLGPGQSYLARARS